MKTILWALFASGVMMADASADEARWTAGLRAELHPKVSGVADTSFYSYTVTGGLTLKVGQAAQAMAVHCTGFDRSGSDGVEGTGACTWTDGEGGVIYAELKTNADGNDYTVMGGTGRWQGAKGALRSTFAFLPGPSSSFMLLTESGSGSLELAQ